MRAMSSLFVLILAAGCGGDTDSGDAQDVFDPPEWCPVPGLGLIEVHETPASPYFILHPEPEPAVTDAPIVIFLPGGPGDQGSASMVFGNWVGQPQGRGAFRIAIPFAEDGDLTDEYDRTVDILDEILTCFGGDREHVHLAGTSNGGIGAYDLMLVEHKRFASLLGAPGGWRTWDEEAVKTALTGKSVYNGVGELDDIWRDPVEQTHDNLIAAGIDSKLVIFEGEGHALSPDFDESIFYDFWSSH